MNILCFQLIFGPHRLKFIDISDIENVEQMHTLENETTQLEWLEWSADGQMLAIATNAGQVHVLLTKLKLIGDAFQANIAYLSSLLEVSCHLLTSELVSHSLPGTSSFGSASGLVLKLDLEPQLVAIGISHLAACINNRVCFYSLELARKSSRMSQANGNNIGQALVREKEYASIVGQMKLNAEYAAVLFTSGELFLHLIEPPTSLELNENESKESKRFLPGEFSNIFLISLMTRFSNRTNNHPPTLTSFERTNVALHCHRIERRVSDHVFG